MKHLFTAAAISLGLMGTTPALGAVYPNTSIYMGKTNEGESLVFHGLALDMDGADYPASYGRVWGFTYSLFSQTGGQSRTVDALVNDKSCANGRYFIYYDRNNVRKIQATSSATKKMLTLACNGLRSIHWAD
jgi:hypothetical protein